MAKPNELSLGWPGVSSKSIYAIDPVQAPASGNTRTQDRRLGSRISCRMFSTLSHRKELCYGSITLFTVLADFVSDVFEYDDPIKREQWR